MSVVTRNVSEYVRKKGINLSELSRSTKIQYRAIYDSLAKPERDRDLRDHELIKICTFLGVEIDELAKKLCTYGKPVIFLGDGVPVHKDRLEKELMTNYDIAFAPAHMNQQRAAAVGMLGIQYYKEGKTETAMEHKPDYLRVSQAEREREERLKAEKTHE